MARTGLRMRGAGGWSMVSACMLAVALTLPEPAAAGDAARGETLYDPCSACHEVGAEARHSVGPALSSIVGRPAATVAGFSYSRAMIEASAAGLVWTPDNIDGYIADPRGFMPGTRMAFGGVASVQDRRDIIAYLEEITRRTVD